MSKIRVVLEAAKNLHPMAVHAYPSEKGKFKVHAVGSKVEHVKKGDTVSSSDLDDLSDAGHKVREVKRPMSESREAIYQRFEKQGQELRAKRAEAAKALADADKKTRERAKANEEVIDEKLTPEAKSSIKTALGPRTPGNPMRQDSKAARTIISMAKKNKKNVVPGTK